jgi:ribonuclease HI
MAKPKLEYDGTLFDIEDAPTATRRPVTTKSAVIYSDGACSPNPGFGGWAAVIVEGERKRTVAGGDFETTNNRMEIQAAIEGLRALAEPTRVKLFTDSQYVRDGITSWLPKWENRGWMTKAKTPVKNQDLWKELSRLSKLHDIDWQWVKGHNGDPFNEECNSLAQNQALRQKLID